MILIYLMRLFLLLKKIIRIGTRDSELALWQAHTVQKKLNDFNINLEIIKTDSFKVFFDKLFIKKDLALYWNKVYEPDYLKFDEYLLKNIKITLTII